MRTRHSDIDDSNALSARQRAIHDHIARHGFATLDALAALFEVSVQTVRREIIHLDRCGLVERFHGGAGAVDKARRREYTEKKSVAREGKQRIAQAIMAELAPHETLFLDVGTTAETLAQAIALRELPLRIVTPSLPAAMALAGAKRIETHVVGGIVGGPDGSLIGSGAAEALSQYHFDRCVISASGFDETWAPTDFDLQKIFLKRIAVRQSRIAILAMDAGKFERCATITVAPMDSFSTLVTDGNLPPPFLDAASRLGIVVQIKE